METMDAIFTRRSVRSFQASPSPRVKLEKILKAAVSAATGGNRQPWTFLVVCDNRRVQALRTLAPGMMNLPAAAIAICLDTSRVTKTKDGDTEAMVWMDIGAAMENILLAAHDLGLGACAIGSFHTEAISQFLKLPPHLELCLLISLGVPARIPTCPKKRPEEDVIFWEEYGEPHG